MKLILVRHSRTKVDPEKPSVWWPLTGEGVKTAQKLSRKPIWKNVDTIYSSPQFKAIETALELAKQNQIPIKIDEDLQEATSFIRGWLKDYEKDIAEFYRQKEKSFFSGETLKEAEKRIKAAVKRIMQVQKGKNTALVSHNNILTIFLKPFLPDKTYMQIHDNMPMPGYAVIDWTNQKLIKSFEA